MGQLIQIASEQSWLGASNQTILLLENASVGKQKYFIGMCQSDEVLMKYKQGPAGSLPCSCQPAQVVVGPETVYSSKSHVDRAAPTSTGPDPPWCWWGWAVWKPCLRLRGCSSKNYLVMQISNLKFQYLHYDKAIFFTLIFHGVFLYF